MGEYADDYFRNEVKRMHGFDPGSDTKDAKPAKRTEKVPCPTCGKKFIGIKDHMRAVHTQEPV